MVFQRYLHHSRLLPLQLHVELLPSANPPAALRKTWHPHRLGSYDLGQPPAKTLEFRGLSSAARSIPGELTSRMYPRPRNQILDIEDHAKLLADALAITVR